MDILVVEDHAATREELLSLIEAENDLRIVGQAATGEDGVRQAALQQPDVIVMDIVMPGMNGIEATREILAANREARILVLSNHTGPNLVRAVRDAGASGYVRKDHAFEELVPAIRAIAQGQPYFGAHIVE